MSKPAHPPKRRGGPQYYRVPAFWGLVATFIIVVVVIAMLLRVA